MKNQVNAQMMAQYTNYFSGVCAVRALGLSARLLAEASDVEEPEAFVKEVLNEAVTAWKDGLIHQLEMQVADPDASRRLKQSGKSPEKILDEQLKLVDEVEANIRKELFSE